MKIAEDIRASFRGLFCSAVMGLTILCVGLIVPDASFAQTKTASVNVVNTPDVNVVNNPNVQSSQSGSWNVGIVGSPTVLIGNTGAGPIPVISSPPEPFQEEVSLSFAGLNASASLPVPEGKRLVIEYVSGTAALVEGERLFEVHFVTGQVGGGTSKTHYFTSTFQGSRPGIADYFSISQQTRLYAIGIISVAAFKTGSLNSGNVQISVSGYLVDQ